MSKNKDFAYGDLFDRTIAKSEVIRFLDKQDEAFFEKYSTSKECVLKDEHKIDALASEHFKNVVDYGMIYRTEKSLKEACAVVLGQIELDNKEKTFPALEEQIKGANARKQPGGDPPGPGVTEMARD